jgi:hypothetical protein
VLGNVLKEDLNRIWSKELFLNYRIGNWIPQKCKKCGLLSLCMCGCKTTRTNKEYCEDKILSDYAKFWKPIPLELTRQKIKYKKFNYKKDLFEVNKSAKILTKENLIITPSGIKIRVEQPVLVLLDYLKSNKSLKYYNKNLDKLDYIVLNLIKIKVINRSQNV